MDHEALHGEIPRGERPISRWRVELPRRDGTPSVIRQWNDDKGQGGTFANHVVKAACRECNSGWMSRLEQRVSGILLRQVQDRDANLTPGERTVLVRWLMKMTAVIEMDDPKSAALSEASRRAIAEGRLELHLRKITHVWLPRENYHWAHVRALVADSDTGEVTDQAVLQLLQVGRAGYIVEYRTSTRIAYRHMGWSPRRELWPRLSRRRRPAISQRRWNHILDGRYFYTFRLSN